MDFANMWTTILSEEVLKLAAIGLVGLLYKKVLEERLKKLMDKLLSGEDIRRFKSVTHRYSSAKNRTVKKLILLRYQLWPTIKSWKNPPRQFLNRQKSWKQKITAGFQAFLDGLAICAFFLVIALAGNWIGKEGAKALSTSEDTSRYNFEDDTPQGWEESKDPVRGIALTEPGVDKTRPLKGRHSLLVRAELDGTETDPVMRNQYAKHQGEVFVDPTWSLPNGIEPFKVTKGLDLSGKTVKALVAVTEKLVGKDLSKPINLQLFVEECDQRLPKILSDPKHISAGSSPTALELPVGSDKKAICRIGIKIALDAKDYNKYETGYIRIDAVDW